MTRSRSEDGQERSRRFSAVSTNVDVNFFIDSNSEYNLVPNLVATSHISLTVMMKLVSALDTVQILILKAEHHQAQVNIAVSNIPVEIETCT